MLMAAGITRVLVTGNLGYIGSILTPMLASQGYAVTGYDTGYYEAFPALCAATARSVARQIRKDVRDAERQDFDGVDAVIHLAALSNDPLGELRPGVTEEINYGATMRVAALAKTAGVQRFVFASSQSIYGVADTTHEIAEDGARNPVTAYARTKWRAEQELCALAGDGFMPMFVRPSTVFGASPKLRCDIVFNNLMAAGYTTGAITVLSDGSPWRPVVHVKDLCDVLAAGLVAPAGVVSGEAFNVGPRGGNYTVRDLAVAARESLPDCGLEITGSRSADERTYRVSFEKLHDRLAAYCVPYRTLRDGGTELVTLFTASRFSVGDFRGPRCNRLVAINTLLAEGALDENLRWTSGH
jgi:nucleoside-diphosphate-sugar epimerase